MTTGVRQMEEERGAFPDAGDGGWGWQRLILALLVLQSIGIRAVPMQGSLSCLLVTLLLLPRVAVPIREMLAFLLLGGTFVLLALRGMSEVGGAVYLFLLLLADFLFVRYLRGRWAQLEADLLQICWFLSLHALVSYAVHLAAPALFQSVLLGSMKYRYLGLLVVSGGEPLRATGLCWEPGLLQYVANLSLFLGIRRSWPLWKLLVSFLTVVATYSTAGIFALLPTAAYLVFSRRRSLRQLVAVAALLVCAGGAGGAVFYENLADKLGGANTSGLIRLRDFRVGLELIQEKPLLGHGQFDVDYLVSHSSILDIESDILSSEYLAQSDDMSGGYTNGLLHILAGYGLLLGAFLYWCFFRNSMIQGGSAERATFFMISLATFLSEPITTTPWFFLMVISGLGSRQLAQRLRALQRMLSPYKKENAAA